MCCPPGNGPTSSSLSDHVFNDLARRLHCLDATNRLSGQTVHLGALRSGDQFRTCLTSWESAYASLITSFLAALQLYIIYHNQNLESKRQTRQRLEFVWSVCMSTHLDLCLFETTWSDPMCIIFQTHMAQAVDQQAKAQHQKLTCESVDLQIRKLWGHVARELSLAWTISEICLTCLWLYVERILWRCRVVQKLTPFQSLWYQATPRLWVRQAEHPLVTKFLDLHRILLPAADPVVGNQPQRSSWQHQGARGIQTLRSDHLVLGSTAFRPNLSSQNDYNYNDYVHTIAACRFTELTCLQTLNRHSSISTMFTAWRWLGTGRSLSGTLEVQT